MEHKTLSFEIKAVDYEGRTLEGYAAAFGNIDQVNDIIHPGAFKKTLSERGPKIKFLWQHDPTEPIGKLVEAREDPGGLFVKAVISDTQRGRDALALLRDGAIGEMSIGYDTIKGAMDYSKDVNGATVRNLREIKLYEFSLVTFPANEMATVTALKQQDITPEDGKPYVIVRSGDKWGVYKEDADGKPDGEALGMHDTEEEAEAQRRALYANEDKGGDPIMQQKVGRTISAANLAKLKAARDVIDELMAMGFIPEEEPEAKNIDLSDANNIDNENKSAKIEVQSNTLTAGPVRPPTELVREIDLNLIELATMEV